MGTRNLTMILLDGEIKVAQYGQWDGYPTGQGNTIAKFLQKKLDLEKFKNRVSEVRQITDKELEDRWVKCGAERGANGVSMEVSDNFQKNFPYLSRDCGAKILELIQDGVYRYKEYTKDFKAVPKRVKRQVDAINNSLDFAADSLFCEFAYLIDLDNEVVEFYTGFNKEKLKKSDRFHYLSKKCKKDDYQPIKLHSTIPFSEFTVKAMEILENSLNEDNE